MQPPAEAADGGTDVDSDGSDEPACSVKHLPRRLLGREGEANVVGGKKISKLGGMMGKSKKSFLSDESYANEVGDAEAKWAKEDGGLVGSMLPPHIKPVLALDDQQLLDS